MNSYGDVHTWRYKMSKKKTAGPADKNGLKTLRVSKALGPIYIKRQCQCCDNSAMMLAKNFLIENNGVAPEWGYNLFSSGSIDFN